MEATTLDNDTGHAKRITGKMEDNTESLPNRITAWLSQLTPETAFEIPFQLEAHSEAEFEAEPDTMKASKKIKGHGKSKSEGNAKGLATLSIAGASEIPRPATAQSGASGSSGRLVERSDYRGVNCKKNNIFFLEDDEALPQHISDVCERIENLSSSEQPTGEVLLEMKGLKEMQHFGARESEVETWFQSKVFPVSDAARESGLRAVPKPSFQHCVPNISDSARISEPIPDLAYGYSTYPRSAPFSDAQELAGMKMNPGMGKIDSDQVLAFPFLVVEFKGEGPVKGAIYVATNQCLGGSATCVETASKLNDLLEGPSRSVNNMAFSIAINQIWAEVYVTWKTDEKYFMREVACFFLKKPEGFAELRRYVNNILDWGKGPRLQEIQGALDHIVIEDQKRTSALARKRQRPANSSSSEQA